jgi:hypothetical protein
MVSLVGMTAAAVGLLAPATVSAQGADPFPDDQQPIGNEYGLPPLDHHGSHAGGGGGANGGGGGGAAGGGGTSAGVASASGGALTASDIRRGQARSGQTGAGTTAGTGERVGISDVPPRTSLSAGEDTRGGLDVLLIVLAGAGAAGLLLAAILGLRRPGRPSF